jgi:hypothetical protein
LSRRKNPNKLNERKGKERKDMTRQKKTHSTFLSESESSGSLEARLSWVYVKKIKIVSQGIWLDTKG